MRRAQYIALCLALCIATGLCCGGGSGSSGSSGGDGNGGSGGDGQGAGNVGGSGNDPGAGNVGGNGGNGGGGGPLEEKMGLTPADAVGYDPSGYSDEPINDPDKLTCDFEGTCCWTNEGETDKADWLVGTKAPDETKFKEHFGNPNVVPSPKYLFTGAVKQDPSYNAIWKSCPIACTASDIIVTFDMFKTDATKFEACTRPLGGGDLENCKEVDRDPDGISLVDLPALPDGGEIVLMASGFTSEDGDFAVIDTIQVAFEPCSEDVPTTTAAPAATTTSAEGTVKECDIECTFIDDDLCGWQDASTIPEAKELTDKTLKPFERVDEYNPKSPPPNNAVRNKETTEADDTTFLSGFLENPNEAAAIYRHVEGGTTKPGKLKIEYWASYEYTQVHLCLNTKDNCPFVSEFSGIYSDLQRWHEAEVDVPAGTEDLFVIARRVEGKEDEGAPPSEVGIANVQWLDENGNPACPEKKRKL